MLFTQENKNAAPFQERHGLLMKKSVGNVRKKSDVSCSLDSNCKFSLVVCAGTGNSSGKNLGTLGHALSELSSILVIYLLHSVSAELANLLAGSLCASGSSFSILSMNETSLFRNWSFSAIRTEDRCR